MAQSIQKYCPHCSAPVNDADVRDKRCPQCKQEMTSVNTDPRARSHERTMIMPVKGRLIGKRRG